MMPFLVRRLLVRVALMLAAMSTLAHAADTKGPPAAYAAGDALWWSDFAALEQQNARYQQPGSVDADGMAQLMQFRDGLDGILEGSRADPEPFLQEIDRLTLEWATAHPASAFAHILHAHALARHGWSYRGEGGPAQMLPEAEKEFDAYGRRASAYLDAHADVALRDSYAAIVLLETGAGLHWDGKRLDAVAQQGLARNPDDIGIYFARMDALFAGDGNAQELDDYIELATEQSRARLGMAMYARLYLSAATSQFGTTLFTRSHAKWSKMKQGFDDMTTRYPDSALWRNRYAFMACVAKDKPALLTQLGALGTRVDAKEWGVNGMRTVEGCRRWARAP